MFQETHVKMLETTNLLILESPINNTPKTFPVLLFGSYIFQVQDQKIIVDACLVRVAFLSIHKKIHFRTRWMCTLLIKSIASSNWGIFRAHVYEWDNNDLWLYSRRIENFSQQRSTGERMLLSNFLHFSRLTTIDREERHRHSKSGRPQRQRQGWQRRSRRRRPIKY